MRAKEAKEIRRQAKKNAPAVMARTLYNLNNAPLGLGDWSPPVEPFRRTKGSRPLPN